jgi:hypothetical protein
MFQELDLRLSTGGDYHIGDFFFYHVFKWLVVIIISFLCIVCCMESILSFGDYTDNFCCHFIDSF